jgi:hypothetical protein
LIKTSVRLQWIILICGLFLDGQSNSGFKDSSVGNREGEWAV